ncbi:MAG: hypothetical protein N2651_03285 [Fimbriimonadales bacterium]|nr:hypothetical protein [Fimbriimonadales bacterium]
MKRGIGILGFLMAISAVSHAQTLVSIGNGISGDTRLVIPVDPYGAWYADFTTGANRGEFYDPVGTLAADYPTFATGTYLFVGTSYRTALNQEPGWGGSSSWAGNLTRTVVSGPTASNYAYNDGVNDTATSRFSVTSGDGVVNLSFDTLVAVRRTSHVIVRYRITNNAASAISFKLYRVWDLDLFEPGEGASFYEDDEVCGGVYGGQGYAVQRELGNSALQFSLSSLNPINGYAAAKRTHNPNPSDPNCPAMGYGTDIQEWNAYGIPACWLNYVAYFGAGPGCSGSSFTQGQPGFGDAHIGVEVPVSIAAGGSAEVIFIHTYGSGRPATCNLADVNLDGIVDDADLLAVLFAFGSSAPNANVDANLDGVVDDADLLLVLFSFGSTC